MGQVGLEDLRESLARTDRKIVAQEALLKERQGKLDALLNELSFLTGEVMLLSKVDQVLLAVSGKVLGQSTATIDKLVTSGLRITFDDQNLEFRTKVDRYRGKTSVEFVLFKDGKTAPIMDSYGGGVLVVAGVLLRVVVIMALGLRRVLLLDESMSHLSREYVPNASKLLRKLCEELDFVIIVVSHESEFAECAHRHYEAYHDGQTNSTKFRLVAKGGKHAVSDMSGGLT